MTKKVINNVTVCTGTYEELKDYFISIQDTNTVTNWNALTGEGANVSDRDGDNYVYPFGTIFNFDAQLAPSDTTNPGSPMHVIFYKDVFTCCFALMETDFSRTICHCQMQAMVIELIKACLS